MQICLRVTKLLALPNIVQPCELFKADATMFLVKCNLEILTNKTIQSFYPKVNVQLKIHIIAITKVLQSRHYQPMIGMDVNSFLVTKLEITKVK